MDLSDLNVLKQDSNGGVSFTEFSSNSKPGLMTNSQSNNNLQLNQPPPIPSRPPVNNNSVITPINNFASGPYVNNSLYNSYGQSNNLNTSGYFNNYSNNYVTPFQAPNSSYLGINNSSNSFLRSAEESSRSAFQSIESVVHAFSAVSAMFESTYYAVYNSFRAVVGVADQFYRLKTHLSGILSALALLRVLKYFYRKCLRLLRLGASIVVNPNSSLSANLDSLDAWSVAKNTDSENFVKDTNNSTGGRTNTNWPLLMFLAVVLGGPYLIWKVLSSIESVQKDDQLWMQGNIDHFIACAEHDFDALNVDELSFRRGQRIIIAPKEYQPKLRGWLLGTIDGSTPGIIPANYVKIMGKKVANNNSNLNTNKLDEPTNI